MKNLAILCVSLLMLSVFAQASYAQTSITLSPTLVCRTLPPMPECADSAEYQALLERIAGILEEQAELDPSRGFGAGFLYSVALERRLEEALREAEECDPFIRIRLFCDSL